eukprot:3765834-Pleurochrysis_carterae.AAC.1
MSFPKTEKSIQLASAAFLGLNVSPALAHALALCCPQLHCSCSLPNYLARSFHRPAAEQLLSF